MNQNIPIEDIQIISVVIEEFVDGFHHGKEEKAYFPVTKYKNSFSEDIRKFLIEHEFARRITKMTLGPYGRPFNGPVARGPFPLRFARH